MTSPESPLQASVPPSEPSPGIDVPLNLERLNLTVPVRLSLADLEAGPDPVTGDADAGGSEGIRVNALVVPWDTPVKLNSYGDTIEFAPGSLDPVYPERVKLLDEHTNHALGYGRSFTSTGVGLEASLEIPRDELADPTTAAIHRQMTNGVRDAMSVGVDVTETEVTDRPDGTLAVRVTDGDLLEVSSVRLPRFDSARITHITASRPHPGDSPMPTIVPARVIEANGSDVPGDPPPEPQPEPQPEPSAELERVLAHRATLGRTAPVSAFPDKWGSIGDFVIANARGLVTPAERDRIGNALADLKTDGIPGLLPAAWVTGWADILNASRFVINAFTTGALPNTGMTVTWPVRTRTGPLTAVQAAQKTEIESGTIGYTTVDTPVTTWAGGNDLAIQAIERSQPSLANLLLEELTYDLAAVEDRAVATDIAAKATGGTVAIGSEASINADLAGAAAAVFSARYGAVPDTFVTGLDLWTFLAGASSPDGRPLFPNLNGANPVGVLSFTDLAGTVRGLRVVASPDIDPAFGIMGWSGAVTTLLGPVRTMTADQPAILGRDIAVYQYGTWNVRRPDALVKVTAPVAPPLADTADTDTSKSKK